MMYKDLYTFLLWLRADKLYMYVRLIIKHHQLEKVLLAKNQFLGNVLPCTGVQSACNQCDKCDIDPSYVLTLQDHYQCHHIVTMKSRVSVTSSVVSSYSRKRSSINPNYDDKEDTSAYFIKSGRKLRN